MEGSSTHIDEPVPGDRNAGGLVVDPQGENLKTNDRSIDRLAKPSPHPAESQGEGGVSRLSEELAGGPGDRLLTPMQPPPAGRAESAPQARAMSGRAGLWIAALCSLFVFALLNWPNADSLADLRRPLLLLDTTPAGGDMGAHVWGPAFLRDHLLPELRLSGWTPDWYSGFPAYHFYMVVPSLAIVALNVGLPWYLSIPLVGLLSVAVAGQLRRSTSLPDIPGFSWIRSVAANPRNRVPVIVLAVLVAGLIISVPYGVAFKLVSVSGLVAFPLAAWVMGRLARSPEPIPAFLALAAFIFLFDTNFTIYGGNITSTLAGEFAFSLSLCLTLLAIGLAIRGMDDNTWLARGAVVIALVALNHIIPVFFLIPALMLAVVSNGRTSARAWMASASVALALIPLAFADGTGLGVKVLAVMAVLVVFGAAAFGDGEILRRSTWLFIAGPVAILLSAFWLLPFYLREPYFNDMGWERLNEVGGPMLTVPMKMALPVAAVGVFLAYASRERIGMIFAGTAMIFAAAVANLGEGPLWNARLLPFYYLSVYMLAAVAVGMVVRNAGTMVSGNLRAPDQLSMTMASFAALIAVFIAVAMPLRLMPFGSLNEDGHFRWLVFTNTSRSAVPSWAAWNYSGYEQKDSYREYHDVVSAMDYIGRQNGCGRAMWEYSKELDRYGTPMALMLLPHWTDGCIGSMEGLYFESSSTTPFHFLNQSVLSDAPSRAQRDLPYKGFDIDLGIAQLQTMGVRYYMAQTDQAIAAAREHPDLTELDEAQPFVVFEVDGSELVEGLAYEPVVVSGRSEEQLANEEAVSRFDVGWVGQAVEHYNNPRGFLALPAEDGPVDWERQESLLGSDGTPVAAAEVSDIEVDTSTIRFSVSEVGSPVMVKASYFPNWKVDGAEGPWRVGPNLMAVVPTDTEVELSYGRTAIDWIAQLLTLLGLAIVGWLVVWSRRSDAVDVVDPAAVDTAEVDTAGIDTVVGMDGGSAGAAPVPAKSAGSEVDVVDHRSQTERS